jgi:sec-independent protein translocase protein TatB
MFDFAWSEIMLIGAVALIAIGPKDMPAAIRTVTGMIKKARKMASEFQTHVDEMVREAELGDLKQTFNDIRRMDITSALEKAVDPDRSIRKTFEENPLDPVPATPEPAPLENEAIAEPAVEAPALEATAIEAPAAPPEPEGPQAPAFIPPNLVPKPATAVAPPEPPAFIPPHQTGA